MDWPYQGFYLFIFSRLWLAVFCVCLCGFWVSSLRMMDLYAVNVKFQCQTAGEGSWVQKKPAWQQRKREVGESKASSLTSSSAVAHALPLTHTASSLAWCVCHFDSFIYSILCGLQWDCAFSHFNICSKSWRHHQWNSHNNNKGNVRHITQGFGIENMHTCKHLHMNPEHDSLHFNEHCFSFLCFCFLVFPCVPEKPGMPCPGEDSESKHSLALFLPYFSATVFCS